MSEDRQDAAARRCEDAISALEGADEALARLLDTAVKEDAPQLKPTSLEDHPAYARDGRVVVYYQPALPTGRRYGSVVFTDAAFLDDGEFWPTSFAVLAVSDKLEAKLRGLVRKAVG
jgi:hypothetical protein